MTPTKLRMSYCYKLYYSDTSQNYFLKEYVGFWLKVEIQSHAKF
jgi:hypothetical protein